MTLIGKKVVIIGGTSGIGLGAAALALQTGAEVVIASRSATRVEEALQSLAGKGPVEGYQLDVTGETGVKDFFENRVKNFDHLVLTAAQTGGGRFLEQDTRLARQLMDNKFWGQYYSARYAAPYLRPGGSITFFSGVVAFKPMVATAALAAVNSAVAGLARTLALELAPLRVNVVSPGIIDTPSRSAMSQEARQAFYEGVARQLPVQKIGAALEVARSVLYLMENEFVTGTILHVDGGHRLV